MYNEGDIVFRAKNDYYGSAGYVALGTRAKIIKRFSTIPGIIRVEILDGPCSGCEHTWAETYVELVKPAKILWEV